MPSPTYKVKFTETYVDALGSLKKHGLDVVTKIQDEAEGLSNLPEIKGKPLVKDLAGLWSKKVYRGRYRIIYSIERTTETVVILFAGIRKEGSKDDVYTRLKKMKKKEKVRKKKKIKKKIKK